MSRISVGVKAEKDSTVNVPVLTGNTFAAPVTLICGSDAAGNKTHTHML